MDRFALVTAGHHFLMNVVPFREPDSRFALDVFTSCIEQSRVSIAELDAVLLRCLSVLDAHSDIRIPTLVERYLAVSSTPLDPLSHFSDCIRGLLRHRCITNGSVQHAIEIILKSYANPACGPGQIAEQIGIGLAALDVAFKRQMGCTLRDHLRSVRMERAAVLLATTSKTIKEIWAAVGYNHASNFDHDFKNRFHTTPRDFRARTIRPLAEVHFGSVQAASHTLAADHTGRRRPHVLIVDDDEGTCSTLQSYLSREGLRVSVATSGAEGLATARETPPDTILLDYRLGDIDGIEFLRSLRTESPGERPAVALFTADWSVLDREQEVQKLKAIVVSKLCDIDHVSQLVTYLSPHPNE